MVKLPYGQTLRCFVYKVFGGSREDFATGPGESTAIIFSFYFMLCASLYHTALHHDKVAPIQPLS